MSVYDEKQFNNFITTAVLHNKDIHHFEVYELDNRLTKEEAINILKQKLDIEISALT